jgi:hypothetical protein
VLLGVEQVCKDYALSLLKSVSELRGLDFESLLEGVEFPRLVFGVDNKREKVVREKRDKVVREKKASVVRDLPRCVLPFLGVLDGCCKGVIRNNNLYTQCPGLPKSDDLCNKCIKSKDCGKFLGLITDRNVGDVEFMTGVKVVKISSYVDVVRKLNIDKDAAVADALRFGWSLSDDYFEEKEKVRGRPKKEKVEGDKTDKSRGRPKKDKKVVSSGVDGDDLIAKLVAEVSDKSSSSSTSSEDDNEVDVPSDAPRMAAVSVAPKKGKACRGEKVEKADEKAAKEAEKAKKADEKAAKEAEKAKKADEKAAKEAEKAKKEAEKVKKADEKAKKAKTPTPPPMAAAAASLEEEDSESSSESPAKVVTVKKFEFGGKKYKLSSENILYDWDTDEPVGIWNATNKCIDEYDNASEEESDEE